MGVAIERTVERGRSKMAERTAAEDEYADRVRAEAATPATSDTAPSVNGTDQ
jgi:hypothetical protein